MQDNTPPVYSTYMNTRLIASAALSAIAALPLSVLATNRTIELSDTERVDIFDEPGSFTWTAPAALVGTARRATASRS